MSDNQQTFIAQPRNLQPGDNIEILKVSQIGQSDYLIGVEGEITWADDRGSFMLKTDKGNTIEWFPQDEYGGIIYHLNGKEVYRSI